MKENLFVIFAPGLGGNHLSNLISLTDRFHRKCELSHYTDGMTNAHFSQIPNLKVEKLKENLRELVDKNNVLCGHIAQYVWMQWNQLDTVFENRKFLTIEFPDKDSPGYRRLTTIEPRYYSDYYFHEQSTLYSQRCLEPLFGEHDFFNISSKDIFNPSIQGIEKFIYEDLCTTWNHDQAQQLHTIWFKNING